jgi:hypothetical protein
MINPTIGRIVWYTGGAGDAPTLTTAQPAAAIVTYVWGDRMVNLAVFDSNGSHVGRTSVKLLQDGDERPAGGPYCEWMPFQKGQAAKTEELEAKLS